MFEKNSGSKLIKFLIQTSPAESPLYTLFKSIFYKFVGMVSGFGAMFYFWSFV